MAQTLRIKTKYETIFNCWSNGAFCLRIKTAFQSNLFLYLTNIIYIISYRVY